MTLRPGTHAVGPDNGSLRVHTYREGMAQKVGHDLVIEVGSWEAKVEVDQGGTPTAVTLQADPGSMRVLEGRRGVKPLTDRDRAEIRSNIDEKILRRQPIAFSSRTVHVVDGRLQVQGELTIAGSTRPGSFELGLTQDGRVSGTLSLRQSDWGIKPYRAFMGALRVRDDVEVVLDVVLPAS